MNYTIFVRGIMYPDCMNTEIESQLTAEDVAMQIIGPVPILENEILDEPWEEGMPEVVNEKYIVYFWSKPESEMDLVMNTSFYWNADKERRLHSTWCSEAHRVMLDASLLVGNKECNQTEFPAQSLHEMIADLIYYFEILVDSGKQILNEIILWSEIRE